jgi:8-oxo-dGTP pyrophosphatase MutT (NUDIX family)
LTHRDFPAGTVPALRARAEAWLAAGHAGRPREAAEPRPSSTVMIVRDAAAGVEVFVLRRAATMAFAPSVLVFPGGGVDVRDADPSLPWAGPGPLHWAGRMGCSELAARELVVAAVREVFEECGVLLAGPDEDYVLGDVSGPEWSAERAALVSKQTSLAQLLIRRDLVLRTDLLSVRSHWVTPVFEPRRYSTWVFAAAVPPAQVPDDRTSETDLAQWRSPEEVLQDYRDGAVLMLPPTVVSMEDLASATSVAALLAERPVVAPIEPGLAWVGDELVLRADFPV